MDMTPEVAMSGTVWTGVWRRLGPPLRLARLNYVFVTYALQKLDPHAEGVVCTFRIRVDNVRDRVRGNALGLSSRRV